MKNADMPVTAIEINGFGQYAPSLELGLTKREHFAGLAMQGWLARCANVPHHAQLEPSSMARIAVEMADALLKQLETEVNK